MLLAVVQCRYPPNIHSDTRNQLTIHRKIEIPSIEKKKEIGTVFASEQSMYKLQKKTSSLQSTYYMQRISKKDVCCFQETHRTGNGDIEYDDPVLKGWKVIYSGFKRRSQAGVGVALAPHVTVVDVIYVEDGRIMCVCIIVNGIKLSVFYCYAPTDTKSYAEQQKIAFYQALTKAMKNVKKEHPGFKVIFGGDFNATIGKESKQNWKCIGNNNDVESTSENGTRLLEFCTEQELYITNSRFGYKDIPRYSLRYSLKPWVQTTSRLHPW